MIIGVSGKIGSGKDLVGQMIQYIGETGKHSSFLAFDVMQRINSQFPEPTNWKIKKFADALKDCVCVILGCTREQIEDRDYKEAPLGEEWWNYELTESPRHIVEYGTYRGTDKEMADERFLEKLTPRKILQLLGTEGGRKVIHTNIWVNAATAGYNGQDWIFTDMRFPNEFEAVQSRGGITIRVERGDGNTGDHPSEIALDDSLDKFDYVIDNNGTMEELFLNVEQIMKNFNLIGINYEDSIRY